MRRQRADHVQQFQRLKERADAIHLPDPKPFKQRPCARRTSRQRGGVRHRRPLRLLRRSDLQRHDMLAKPFRLSGKGLKPVKIAHALQVQPQNRDPRVLRKSAMPISAMSVWAALPTVTT